MHRFFSSILVLFLSPVGLLVLAALDSSMVFFLPTAVEATIVILVDRSRELAWLFPIMATAGSVAGALITLRIGAKLGNESIERWVPNSRLRYVQERIRRRKTWPLGAAGLMPPPFPMSALVLASGALGVQRLPFLMAFGVARLVRFSLVAVLAFFYGRGILRIMRLAGFQSIIIVFAIVAIVGTALGIYRIIHNPGTHRATTWHR